MKTTTRKLPETEEEAVTANKGLIFKFLRKYRFRWVGVLELADAEQLCRIGLMKAFRTFDASRKAKFSTWAFMKMRGEVSEELGRARYKLAFDDEHANPDLVIDRAEPLDAIIWTEDTCTALRRTLAATVASPNTDRDCFHSGLRFCCFWLRLNGYQYQTIADLFGCVMETVRHRVHRVCDELGIGYEVVSGMGDA